MPIKKLRPNFSFTQDRIEQLKAVVPEAFADGKINFDSLREALGEYLEDQGHPEAEHGSTELAEVFGLFWPGKREARRLATLPSKGTLVPAPGEGIDEDKTCNIFIEGENLEVLKLLQRSYAGRIKMIYIDPPYNTGNDFVYKDDFKAPLEEYLKRTGQADENGKLLTTNTKASGRFHSNWLNMMYPRLVLARQFLREDGAIFVSIDDNEVHNLRTIISEIFGEENFIAQIIIQSNPRGRQSERFVATVHEYLLVFAKNSNECSLFGSSLTKDQLKEFKYQDQNGQKYRLLGLRQRGSASRRQDRPKMFYPLYVNPRNGKVAMEEDRQFSIEVLPKKSTGEDGRWMWSKQKVQENLEIVEARFISTRNEWDLFVRDYLHNDDGEERTRKLKTIWIEKELNYQNGTQEVKRIFESGVIDYPKPASLLSRAITMAGDPDGLYFDFFGGSCTTAQAVLELNQLDDGNRRFIVVDLPERVADDSLALEAGYKTIAEIGKERIRRVIAKMKKESNGKSLSKRETSEDLGFKVFKLARSNFKAWQDYDGESIQELETLFDQAETPLVKGWKEDDLLTEIMLQQGFPLDSKIARQSGFKSNKVQLIESEACSHRLFVCLDPKIKEDTIKHLELRTEDIFVCLDSAITDQAKMRLADICRLDII